MAGRYVPNPHISQLAGRIVAAIDRELQGSLLSGADQAAVLLAAAHGRAGLSREQMHHLAELVWNACDEGKRRDQKTVDFEIAKVDQKLQS